MTEQEIASLVQKVREAVASDDGANLTDILLTIAQRYPGFWGTQQGTDLGNKITEETVGSDV